MMTDLEKIYAYVAQKAIIGSIDRGYYNGLPGEKYTHGTLTVADANGKIVANLSTKAGSVEQVRSNLVTQLATKEKLKTLVLSLTT